jgi:hypothetical protein
MTCKNGMPVKHTMLNCTTGPAGISPRVPGRPGSEEQACLQGGTRQTEQGESTLIEGVHMVYFRSSITPFKTSDLVKDEIGRHT